jgi:hypothetical protein
VPYSLSFRERQDYDPGEDGITVSVILSTGYKQVRLLAKVDTGASNCIFQREYGEELGLDLEAGTPKRFGTVVDSFLAYGHDLTLSALGYDLAVTAYFASVLSFPRNVLGRHGWLQLMRLGLVDYDGKLYASRYDKEAP